MADQTVSALGTWVDSRTLGLFEELIEEVEQLACLVEQRFGVSPSRPPLRVVEEGDDG
jgi:hypothetical protein